MNKEAIIERQANENLKLVNDNKDLQQRIDDAIELIEQDYFEDGSGIYIEQVLSILKGEEQENSDYERTIWETEYDSATSLEKKIIDRLQILENKVNDIEDKEWSKMNEI